MNNLNLNLQEKCLSDDFQNWLDSKSDRDYISTEKNNWLDSGPLLTNLNCIDNNTYAYKHEFSNFLSLEIKENIIKPNAPFLQGVLPRLQQLNGAQKSVHLEEQAAVMAAKANIEDEDEPQAKKKTRKPFLFWGFKFPKLRNNGESAATSPPIKEIPKFLIQTPKKEKYVPALKTAVITFLATLCINPSLQAAKPALWTQKQEQYHIKEIQEIHEARKDLTEITKKIKEQKATWDAMAKSSSIEDWAEHGVKNRHLKPLITKIFNQKINSITPDDWKPITDSIDNTLNNGATLINNSTKTALEKVEQGAKDNEILKTNISFIKTQVSTFTTQQNKRINDTKESIKTRISAIKPRQIPTDSQDPLRDIAITNAQIEQEMATIIVDENNKLTKQLSDDATGLQTQIFKKLGIDQWKNDPQLRALWGQYGWAHPNLNKPEAQGVADADGLLSPSRSRVEADLKKIFENRKSAFWREINKDKFYIMCNADAHAAPSWYNWVRKTVAHVGTLGACSSYTLTISAIAAGKGFGIDVDALWNIVNAISVASIVVSVPLALARGGAMLGATMVGQVAKIGAGAAGRIAFTGAKVAIQTTGKALVKGITRAGLGGVLKVGAQITSTVGKVTTKVGSTISRPFIAGRSVLSNIIAKDAARQAATSAAKACSNGSCSNGVLNIDAWVKGLNSATNTTALKTAIRNGPGVLGEVAKKVTRNVLPS